MTNALTDSRYRYRIFAMVFFIALINYVDRGALSFAANDISHEFNFNKAQLGAVWATSALVICSVRCAAAFWPTVSAPKKSG